jgi:arabinose-5-phosphate isomerase
LSIETARAVLEIEAEAIRVLIDRLDQRFETAVELILECRGRVVASGMGKSGIICRKIATTLSSTGTPSLFLHPAEAVHGDLGVLAPGDVVLSVSNSGETEELLKLISTIKRLGISLISMVGNPRSSIARQADVVLDISENREACPR